MDFPNFKLEDITLKNVKIYDKMSEETTCFQAVIHVQGKPLCTVENSGKGGCDDMHPTKGNTYEDISKLVALVGDATGETFEPLSLHVSQLLNKIILDKKVKKWQVKGLVFQDKKDMGDIRILKYFLTIEHYLSDPKWIEVLKSTINKYTEKGFVCLNTNLSQIQ